MAKKVKKIDTSPIEGKVKELLEKMAFMRIYIICNLMTLRILSYSR